MLEFILFLNTPEKEILNLIRTANYEVEENTPLCLIGDSFFGFLKKQQKKIVICTENAKKYGGYNFATSHKSDHAFKTGLMIRRALRHEAVHVAQECNDGKTLNMLNNREAEIISQKRNALRGSIALTGNAEEEYEAYKMEDKPRKIISALKKFCLNNKTNKREMVYQLYKPDENN